jgi:sporulation protein YlmC with PRC-barrel domain
MNQLRMLDARKELKGRTVLAADTGDKLGEVEDVLVRPTEGSIVGILVRSTDSSGVGALPVGDFKIGEHAVMAAVGRVPLPAGSPAFAGSIRACDELTGVKIVTEAGQVIGTVSDIFVSAEKPVFVYRIAGSAWQKWTGGGNYLEGDVPSSLSSDRRRLIVPADTAERHAHGSLEEIVTPDGNLVGAHK